MGVKNLSQLLTDVSTQEIRKDIKLEDLSNKTLALDAFNQLFQFLATIRDFSGGSMADASGTVTSHLIGLLTRNCNLLKLGIIPVYVYDGESHYLKREVQERRRESRRIAELEYEKAIKMGDMEKARSFAQRMNKLTTDMINDSKKLLDLMGVPWIQGPGEGEAQAAMLAREGSVYATASQDYDALLFGSPILVRNLNITGKRNLPGGRTITINPEEYQLNEVLDGLELTQEQLIDLGILLGTDFNPDGFKGIGVKTAYKLIKKYGDFNTIAKNEEKLNLLEVPYDEIKEIFLTPNVRSGLKFEIDREFDVDGILKFLVDERGFSEDRYKNLLFSTKRELERVKKQSSLDEFF